MTTQTSGSAQNPAGADPRVGAVVAGAYRVLAPLGEGGIGTVYRAEHVPSGRQVALKLLRGEHAQEAEVVARFEREARAMHALASEHIVAAYDLGRTPDGEIYMAMELVEGESLRRALGRVRPMPLPHAVELARQVGAALAHAHAQGVVHRDLKPENVMVGYDASGRPRVKVLDFGMARLLGGAAFGGSGQPLTKKGAVFGTPEYMCPEQACGAPVDARADQYSLGVMVYEMVAGRRPFAAATPLDLLQMQIHDAPPALAQLAPWVPAPVADVINRMMAKRPDQRFPDVTAAVTALASAATAPAPVAAPASLPHGPSPMTGQGVAPRAVAPAPASPGGAQVQADANAARPAQGDPAAAASQARIRLVGAIVLVVVIAAVAIALETWARSSVIGH